MYINEIFKGLKLYKFVLFVDDTNIFYRDVHFKNLIGTINNELDIIKKNVFWIANSY